MVKTTSSTPISNTMQAAGTMEPGAMKLALWPLRGFSCLAFASVVESIAACNQISGEVLVELSIVALSDVVVGDMGVHVQSQKHPDENEWDLVILCGSAEYDSDDDTDVIEWLSRQRMSHRVIGSVASATRLLAKAGILNGAKSSLHGRDFKELQALYPRVILSTDVFSFDRNKLTCRGGSAALDMMVFYLGRCFGVELAEAISRYFVQIRVGGWSPTPRKELSSRDVLEQPKLAEALELMENNIEEPLTTDDLAYHVGISRRQLERLFKRHLDTVPSRYYLQYRLEKGRAQLLQSVDSISAIALACGFSSGAHFSTSYRNFFGLSPSEERQQIKSPND